MTWKAKFDALDKVVARPKKAAYATSLKSSFEPAYKKVAKHKATERQLQSLKNQADAVAAQAIAVKNAQAANRLYSNQLVQFLAQSNQTQSIANWITFGNGSATTPPAQTMANIVIPVTSGTSTQMVPAMQIAQAMTPAQYVNMPDSEWDDLVRTITVRRGEALTVKLPDGGRLEVLQDGSYKLIDGDAKITYEANRSRAFNRYLNASDLLEGFMRFVSDQGNISRDDFLNLPVELFIRWLIVSAAEADGEPADFAEVRSAIQPALPAPEPVRLLERKCKCCGKFVSRKRAEAGVLFCSPEHFSRFAERLAA